jgi:hypothetical protein
VALARTPPRRARAAQAATEIAEEKRLQLERQRQAGFVLLGIGICLAVGAGARFFVRPTPAAREARRAATARGRRAQVHLWAQGIVHPFLDVGARRLGFERFARVADVRGALGRANEALEL